MRDGNDCVLAEVRPFLTITYTLPKPSAKLPPDVAARWRVFIEGMRAHEAVHGQYVVEMAQEIYDATLGFRQPGDPGCKTIRQAIQVPLKAAFDRYKARNRNFEQTEMSAGGQHSQADPAAGQRALAAARRQASSPSALRWPRISMITWTRPMAPEIGRKRPAAP